jgi:hypothetical protein
MPCQYCNAPDTIEHSHVVSDFIIRYCRCNSVRQALFYTWDRQEYARRMITGPYLCSNCDNVVFSDWEKHFEREVFRNPLAATHEWGQATSIRFIFSIAFRYAVHCLRVENNPAHEAIAVLFRDLCREVLNDPTRAGQTAFVYPYVYRPITERCDLRHGINNFLSLAYGDRFQLPAHGLPNRYLIQLPGMLFLFSVSSLPATGLPGYVDLVDLRLNTVLDPATCNLRILELCSELLNDGVQQTMNHQTAYGRWHAFIDAEDRLLFPHKKAYVAQRLDYELQVWQGANCGP